MKKLEQINLALIRTSPKNALRHGDFSSRPYLMPTKFALTCCLLLFLLLLVACGRGRPDADYPEPTPEVSYDESTYPSPEPLIIPVDIPSRDHYDISLTIDPATQTITSGISRITFTNRTGGELYEILLRVPLNAFSQGARHSLPEVERNVFRHGRDYGVMYIRHVTIDDEDMDFTLEGTVLTLEMDEPLLPDATVQLVLQFEAYVPMIAHRIGGNEYAMWFGMFLPVLAVYGAEGWVVPDYYPVGDPFVLEMADFVVELITPADYIVAGTGVKSGMTPDEDTYTRVTTFTASSTRDFSFALSPHFKQEWISTEGGDIHLYYFTEGLPVDDILDSARVSMEYFSYLVGHYPFDHIRIVETEIFREGMAFSNVIFMDTQALQLPNHAVLAQNLGHQWFFNVVGSDPVAEPWLDRGLVRYLNMRRFYGQPYARLAHIARVYGSISAREDLYLARGLGAFDNWGDYYHTHYAKGMLMFHALNYRMGEELFWELVRQYFQAFYFRIATGADFIRLAEEIYGGSLEDFFEEWFGSGAVPALPPGYRIENEGILP